jgi:glutamine amidotransferase
MAMTKKPTICIIDYGMGNLGSIVNALRFIGYDAIVTDSHPVIEKGDVIILPGVGAFGKAVENLKAKGLDTLLTDQVIARKKPFLGICLGMQLLAHSSEESPSHAGLGWIPGKVKCLPKNLERVPHMGWNHLDMPRANALYKDLPERPDVYFVHSYYFDAEPQYVSAYSNYGIRFTASLSHDNIHAVQYHPEKSHHTGLTVLKNFMCMIGE